MMITEYINPVACTDDIHEILVFDIPGFRTGNFSLFGARGVSSRQLTSAIIWVYMNSRFSIIFNTRRHMYILSAE